LWIREVGVENKSRDVGAMTKQFISQAVITQQLLDLGVEPGGLLLVHCAFSRVRPIEGGPLGLIAALRAALGPYGTLVMPSMADDDAHLFDPHSSACLGMGVVANTFWQLPDVLRSDNMHAFAAVGPQAANVIAPHPIEVPHGLDSPVGRAYERNGQVLLLGVGHDANTTIHLAELLAGVRYRCKKHALVLRDGQLVQVDYDEIDHCCQNFCLVDGWLEARALQRRGQVGYAEARLMRAQDVVDVVVAQLQRDETAFLHPLGVDEECDEARASLSSAVRP
jgi:aminoglycoside N3'-acetyltransferase